MSLPENKYTDRLIGENENALLDRIWEGISDSDAASNKGELRDVHTRLERRRRRRIVRAVGAAGGAVAAVMLLAVLVWSDRRDTAATGSELAYSHENVSLYSGGSAIAELQEYASIEADGSGTVVRDGEGKSIEVDPGQNIVVIVPAGKRFELMLADGTRVQLNSGSRFGYSSSYGEGNRAVELEGEAWFDVTSDQARPFVVSLPGGESIRVLGTGFNVMAYADEGVTVATLASGSIEYAVAGYVTKLTPGQQISVDRQTHETSLREVNPAEFSMWVDDVLYFNDEPLEVLARRMERMYGITIDVAPEHRTQRFSGMVRRESGLEHIVRLLTTSSEVTCRIEDGTMYLM